MIAVPIGGALTVWLFTLLSSLVVTEQLAPPQPSDSPARLLMLAKDSQVQLRERTLPPEPELQPPSAPSMPTISAPSTEIPKMELSFDVPNVELALEWPSVSLVGDLQVEAPAPSVELSPTVLQRMPPSYPRRALNRKIEGQVVVEFVVNPRGEVEPESARIVEATPEGVFDASVLRAIYRWRFKPRLQNGEGVAYSARQTLDFKLSK
ncbi:MAG: energy transducer TonB [Pontibacterium sp.]